MDKPFIFGSQERTDNPGFRAVERISLHEGPQDLSELIESLIPRDAKYVVFDLDRTFHLEQNVGELLGWDLAAREAWGTKYHHLVASQDRPSKFVFDPDDLAGNIRYLSVGARTWAVPGLIYGLWMKLVYANRHLRPLAFLYHGAEPVKAVQQIPQGALMHQMSRYRLTKLRRWALLLMHRLAPEMTITPEHILQIRERCPDAQIIISSASPQPVLEAAAEYFGVDDVIYSEIETLDELISSPPWLQWFFHRQQAPERFAPLSSLQINNSHAKVRRLLARFPDFAEATTVGFSDTDKGEDHAWISLFKHLVDVNSNDPFPPIVPLTSPTQSIDSVTLLSVYEKNRRAGGEPDYLDPSRRFPPASETRVFAGEKLAQLVSPFIEEATSIQREGYTVRARIRDAIDAAWTETTASLDAFNEAVERYNTADEDSRTGQLESLSTAWKALRATQQNMTRLQRPFSDKYQALQSVLRNARAALTN